MGVACIQFAVEAFIVAIMLVGVVGQCYFFPLPWIAGRAFVDACEFQEEAGPRSLGVGRVINRALPFS